MILRVSPCMPPGALFLFSSRQEPVISGNKAVFSGYYFLWFPDTLAGELDCGQCTHCSGKHCFPRVPRVPIIIQSWQESRQPARVTRKPVNKARKTVNKAVFPARSHSAFPQYLRDYQGVPSCTEPGSKKGGFQCKTAETRPIPPGRAVFRSNVAPLARRTNASVSITSSSLVTNSRRHQAAKD